MNPIRKIVVIGPESTGKSTLCAQLAAHYQTSWCPEYAREYLLKHGTDYTFDDLLTIAKGQLQLEDSWQSAVGREQSAVSSRQSAVGSQQSGSTQQTTIGDTFTIDDSRFTTSSGQLAGTQQKAIGDEFTIHHSPFTTSSQQPAASSGLSSVVRRLLFLDTDMYVMKVWCEFVFGQCHPWILDKIVERKYDLYLLCKPDLPWVKDELREYPDLQSREKLYHIYKDLLINQTVPWAEISGSYEERLPKAVAAVDQITSIS